jgi:uncharacterized protein YkwD
MVTRHAGLVLAAAVFAAIVLAGVLAVDTDAASAATVRSCTGGSIKLKPDEKRVLELQNRVRKSRGMRPLCVHPALRKAARSHSADMIRKDYFRHGNVDRRLKRHGYRWRDYAENIAWGSGRRGSPERVFKRWMKSHEHKRKILTKGFREVGIGTATGTFKGTKGVTMYTVDFGTRRR